MFWIKRKLDYEILIPPLKRPINEFSSAEAQSYFDWYMGEIPKRIEYITGKCAEYLNVNPAIMDLSPKSLLYVWKWFLEIAETERTPIRQLDRLREDYKDFPSSFSDYFVNESKEQFSLQTEYIIRDIGMYMGQVFVYNNSKIHWSYYEKPKTDFFVNIPLLLGFEDSNFTPPFPVEFEPIHMVGVQAAKIWGGRK
jgi:hypothetical protein